MHCIRLSMTENPIHDKILSMKSQSTFQRAAIQGKGIAFAFILLILTLALSPLSANSTLTEAQKQLRGEQLTIKLLTVGPGDLVYLWYGHSALVVEDRAEERTLLFDYGVFDFRQDNFYRNFAAGRLIYGVMAMDAGLRYRYLEAEDRAMEEIVLDLPPAARYEVASFLISNVQPGNNTYRYHHYYNNCATKLRDIIDEAVDGQFSAWAQQTAGEMSYRDHIRRFSNGHLLMDWLLNFLQSGVIDRSITRWDDMFLPSELQQALLEFSYTDSDGVNKPIVLEHTVLNIPETRNEIPESPRRFWPVTAAAGAAAALIGLFFYFQTMQAGKGRWRILYGSFTALFSLIPSILSFGLLLMMLFTDHDVTCWNENVLVASPLLAAAGIVSIRIARGRSRNYTLQKRLFLAQAILIGIELLGKLFFRELFIQQNWMTILFILPPTLLWGVVTSRYRL